MTANLTLMQPDGPRPSLASILTSKSPLAKNENMDEFASGISNISSISNKPALYNYNFELKV